MDGSKMTGRYKKMKKGKSWVIILVAVICIGLLGWYSTAVITDTKQKQEATANGESTKDKDYQNIKLVSTSQVVFQSPIISRTRILQTRT